MAYQPNTASILKAAGYEPLVDFEAESSGGDLTITWLHTDPQPSEAQVAAWGDDSQALPSGQTFADFTTVPKEVTNYQLRRALNASPAAKAQVVALINGSDDEDMKDGWAAAATFKQDNPLFQAGITQLGWTQQQVNNILILAATFD